MDKRLSYADATESELNDLLEGKAAGVLVPWRRGPLNGKRRGDTIGVLVEERADHTVRPYAIVADEGGFRRLFTRYATLRGDLSPLSAWCHILKPDWLVGLDQEIRQPELNQFGGAWTGLVVAEALLRADRSVGQLRIAACLSTQTFSVIRTKSLWNHISVEECLERHMLASRVISGGDTRWGELQDDLWPIWTSLLAASHIGPPVHGESQRIVDALRMLAVVRARGATDELAGLYRHFSDVPEAAFLMQLEILSAEARVQQFDNLLNAFKATQNSDRSRRQTLLFLAGYLATIVAGGNASLSLTAESAKSLPAVTAWAYTIGGVGEKALWTSSFDGLGRLVARELERPLHLDEPPVCDIALDEALVLVDRQLSDPLVRLRVKQTRVLTVSLLPGVNITVPLKEAAATEEKRATAAAPRGNASDTDLIGILVEALLPRLEKLMKDRQASSQEQAAKTYSKRRKVGQTKLL